MNADHQLIVQTIISGGSVDEAAQRVGRPVATVRRWLSQGRKNPDGQWGKLAQAVDSARLGRSRVPEDAGQRLAEVEAFLATVDVTPEMAPRVGLLRTIARKLDWAEKTNTGIAAMAAERLAGRYAELLDAVQPVSSSDTDKLVAALKAGVFEDEFRHALVDIAAGKVPAAKAAAEVLKRDKAFRERGLFE